MRVARAAALSLALALMGALAGAAVAQAPTVPVAGVFVAGEALGGVRLGMTKADVRARWGRTHGVCGNCAHTTWYFNLKPFEPQGAAVEFRDGRVARVYTVWRPVGWRTADGLALGAEDGELREALPGLRVRACDGYTARVAGEAGGPTSVYYVFRGRLWAFALMRPGLRPCL